MPALSPCPPVSETPLSALSARSTEVRVKSFVHCARPFSLKPSVNTQIVLLRVLEQVLYILVTNHLGFSACGHLFRFAVAYA